MGEAATGTARSSARPWGHNATRLAILEAARRIVASEGMQRVSLSRAADEAGFARATVYGHFRNKEEMLVSIVADDLAMLGRIMRKQAAAEATPVAPAQIVQPEEVLESSTADLFVAEAFERSPQEAASLTQESDLFAEEPVAEEPVAEEPVAEEFIEPVAEEAEPVAQEAEPQEEHTPQDEPVEEPVDEPIVEAPLVAAVPDSEPFVADPRPSVRRANLREILQTPEIAEPEPARSLAPVANEDAPRPGQPRVDAWLERRLRVFERELAEIGTRLEKAERGSERAQGLVAEGMRDIQQNLDSADARQRQSVEGVARRIDTAEQRQHAAIGQLRAEIHAVLNPSGEKGEAAGSPEFAAFDETQFMPSANSAANEQQPKSEPSQSFLSAARRAANAAAELAESERNISGPLMGGLKWPTANDDRRKLYTRYLIAGTGILVLTLIGAGMVLRNGSDEVKLPAPRMSSAHAETVMPPTRNAIPLDKVTALANSGDAQAELIVGLKYLHGNGASNDASAAQWLQRSADAHDAVAQYLLGTLYERGLGVQKDSGQAVHWFESAAVQGNRKAMYRLGVAYAEGRGVTKDFVQAVRWFTQAANAGLLDAQFNLAVLYERGQGVPQSLLDAYKWYAIAASHGDEESQARVEALSSQLSPDDMVAAERAVQEFSPSDFDREANVAPTIADVTGPKAE